MQNPIQISFHGIDGSPSIDEYVRRRAEKLDTFSERVIRCRVAVEAPHQHQRRGRDYRVRIDVTLPGGELVVGRRPGANSSHPDLYAAIDHAFDGAGRMLQDFVRRQRGDIKTH